MLPLRFGHEGCGFYSSFVATYPLDWSHWSCIRGYTSTLTSVARTGQEWEHRSFSKLESGPTHRAGTTIPDVRLLGFDLPPSINCEL